MKTNSTSSVVSILLLSTTLISLSAKCETRNSDYDDCLAKRHRSLNNFHNGEIKCLPLSRNPDAYKSCMSDLKKSEPPECPQPNKSESENVNNVPEYGNDELNECLLKNAREQNSGDNQKACLEIKTTTNEGLRNRMSCQSKARKQADSTRKEKDRMCKLKYSSKSN